MVCSDSRAAPLCRSPIYPNAIGTESIRDNGFIKNQKRMELTFLDNEQSLNASNFFRAMERTSI
jgi:hypothetical protein